MRDKRTRALRSSEGPCKRQPRARLEYEKREVTLCFVERHPLAARWLRWVMKAEEGIHIVSENDVLGVSRPQITAPIFVIDIETLYDSPSSFLIVVRSRFSDAKILVLASELSPDQLRPLLFMGIEGFVSYDRVEADLAAAIRSISR